MKIKIISVLSAVLIAFVTYAKSTIFDDAVFWFRGGKECVTANGMMEEGEFFDALHANDLNHPNHKLPIYSYPENALFRTEQVVFPTLGKDIAQEAQVLHITDVTKAVDGVNYRHPLAINARQLLVGNNISNHYTFVARLRLDRLDSIDWLFAIGYNGAETSRKGILFGFEKKDDKHKYVIFYRPADSSSKNGKVNFTDLYVATNTWFDLSVVVGSGKVRVGWTMENKDKNGNTTNTQVYFNESSMWTDNCTFVDGNSPYRFFAEKAYSTEEASPSSGNFEGSVHQLAIWNRVFTDAEVVEAFRMTSRPQVFSVGLDNGASNEFAPERKGSAQTIEGLSLDCWQEVTDTMVAGDVWTINFPVMASESETKGPLVPYVFSLRSLPDSETATLQVSLNGRSLGRRHIGKSSKAYWPVAAGLFVSGQNTLTIRRTDKRNGAFKVDSMELGGALAVGWENGGTTDIGSAATWKKPSADCPNPTYWWNTLQTYDKKNEVTLRLWVDPDLKDKCPATLQLRTKCLDRSGSQKIKGTEFFTISVKGKEKGRRDCYNQFSITKLIFEPGELDAGWNEIVLRTEQTGTCYWQIDYYRFWLTLDEGFTDPPAPGPGFVITAR